MAQYLAITGLNRGSASVRVPAQGEIVTPTTLAGAPSVTAAGALVDDDYFYRVTALGNGGETLPSLETQETTTGDTNEVQTITESGATGGTFTLTFDGQTTGDIPVDSPAATITSALTGLSTIGGGNVTTSRSGDIDDWVYQVTFQGDLAGTGVSQIVVDDTDVVGGTVVGATLTPGLGGQVVLTWDAVSGADGYRVYRGTVTDTYDGHYDVVTNTWTDTGKVTLTAGGTVPTESSAVTDSGQILVKAGVTVIVDIDDPAIRKALGNHSSIGQWATVAVNNEYQALGDTLGTLPVNS